MDNVTQAAYLLTSTLFIIGILRLRSPATARSGNLVAAAGMLLAIAATLANNHGGNLGLIAGGIVVGTVAGFVAARTVRMTAMPQMVALFNGMGAGAATLVSLGEVSRQLPTSGTLAAGATSAAVLSMLIGSVSFTGSLVAFAKLQELLTGRPITFPYQNAINGILLVALVVAALVFIFIHASGVLIVGYVAGALLLGVLFVIPIGGADMPVIISLLNSFTGLSAAATGFVVGNNALVIGGTLVGASGTILTILMGRAMNRTLTNVLFGAFGGAAASGAAPASGQQTVRSASAEDVATLLAFSTRVVIVPGYGLAVARAQQEVRELTEALEKRGVTVKFAIHPVAGRMPGHMNVLLAEANIPYPQLYEMEAINPELPNTDVALIIGANDVTNPAARSDPRSPIYGMPIIDADQARTIVVLKRGMSTGFAGIDNPLFYNPKTLMLFGDARESLLKLLAALKEV